VYGAPGPLPDAFGVDQNIRTPYMGNYNLNLQQQLSRKMTLQIGYVGSRATNSCVSVILTSRLRRKLPPRLRRGSTARTWQPCPGGFIRMAASPADSPVPPPFCPYYINFMESSANSIYNSLQTSLHIGNWHGLTSTLNYTWSHSLDDASDGEITFPTFQPNDALLLFGFNRGNSTLTCASDSPGISYMNSRRQGVTFQTYP